MFSMLTSGGVDCRFEPISGQTTDYKTGICCFSAKRAPLRRKFRDWLVKWSDMSTPGLRRKCRKLVGKVERHVYPWTKEEVQRLVGKVERHVYPWTVSVR